MAVTKMSNMINPEVMGAMIGAKIDALLKLTPYAKVDTTLVGVPGDTKTVPSWNYIGDAEDVAEGAEVGLSTLTASSTTFTIKKAMKAVGITQEAVNSGLGNPIGQAETQLAKSIAGKVDSDVLDAVYKGKNVYAASTLAGIAYGGIVDAVAKFEDEEDGIEKLKHISFQIRKGEIYGIAGVEGNGQSQISEAITGLLDYRSGTITVNGEDVKGKSIRKIREMGVSHVSEDRMTYGIAADSGVKDNVISDRYYKKEFNKGLFLDDKKINNLADQLIKDFLIKCDNRDSAVRMLSGVNMQKVVTAREFSNSPHLVVANQPTRGVDVGATEFIRKKIVQLRDDGTAVLLISADLNEVLELSDSLIVMHNGHIAAYIPDASKITDMELGEYMLGVKEQTPEEIARVAYDR